MSARGRLWATLAAWVLFVPAATGLILLEERIEPRPPVRGQEMKGFHPLLDMTFTEATRGQNLEKVGMPPELVEQAMAEIGRAGQRKAEIGAALRDRVDPNNVALALCPQSLPVVYRAAILLVSGPPGQTRLVDPRSPELGAPWDAFPRDDVDKLFTRWETPPDRRAEDTLIALSALVQGRVGDAIGGAPRPPWDRRTAEGGSWGAVSGAIPDIGRTMVQYIAWTQVLGEIVEADPAAFGCAKGTAGGKPTK